MYLGKSLPENNAVPATETKIRPAAAPGQVARAVNRLPPTSFFLTSAVFHYLGPPLAALLFVHMAALGVAWLRIASAAVVFAAWRRPWRIFTAASRSQRLVFIGLGRHPCHLAAARSTLSGQPRHNAAYLLAWPGPQMVN